jgi:hypothetical protein
VGVKGEEDISFRTLIVDTESGGNGKVVAVLDKPPVQVLPIKPEERVRRGDGGGIVVYEVQPTATATPEPTEVPEPPSNVYEIEGGRKDYLTVRSSHPDMKFVVDPEKAKSLPSVMRRLQHGKTKVTLSLEAERNAAYSAGGDPGYGMSFIDGSYIAFNVHGSDESDELFLRMFLNRPPDPNYPLGPGCCSSVTNSLVAYSALYLLNAPAEGYRGYAHNTTQPIPELSQEEINYLMGWDDYQPLFSVRPRDVG